MKRSFFKNTRNADFQPHLSLFFILALLSYFLLFSSFATYHVYAANELDDPHGCEIGGWVHQGHQNAASTILSGIALTFFSILTIFHPTLPKALLLNERPKRGPPLFSLN